jgi:TetR/AcrR family transcriptional regulator
MRDAPTRDQILDAAEGLFAAQGFARTTIKQIGREAGVNSALLYYYFGDKERLYHEVLQRLMAGLVERTMSQLQGEGDPVTRLRRFVAAQAEVLASRPTFPKLIMRELVDHDASHAVTQVRQLSATSFRRLCELVQEGQRAKVFRPDLDPRFAAVSIVAQLAHFFMAWPAVRVLLDARPALPPAETVRDFARHAAEFALAALLVPAGATARKTAPRTRSSR